MKDTTTGGEFTRLCQEVELEILDQKSLTNQDLHTQEVERETDTNSIRASSEYRVTDDTMVQEVAQQRMKVGFLTNKFTMINCYKVNEVGI